MRLLATAEHAMSRVLRSWQRALQQAEPGLIFWLSAWYLCSLVTLFLNKIILSTPGGDQYILGITQMIVTAVLGAAKVYGPRLLGWESAGGGKSGANGLHRTAGKQAEADAAATTRPPQRYSTFYRDMVLVGIMRGLTVLLGLVSLSHVAVSFTETVKSSAPFFTVIISRLMLDQRTSWQVNMSLVPVMLGLTLCSATELSFDTIGFLAAIANNIIDCVQNVFSKQLLENLTPVQLQFYTSAAAATLQLPILLYSLWPHLHGGASQLSGQLVLLILIDAVFYHLQSVTAYCTMNLLTPVSQSVANTVKRALLIFLSILWFGNPVTVLNVSGMAIVTAGVFVYNHCRIHYPQRGRHRTVAPFLPMVEADLYRKQQAGLGGGTTNSAVGGVGPAAAAVSDVDQNGGAAVASHGTSAHQHHSRGNLMPHVGGGSAVGGGVRAAF